MDKGVYALVFQNRACQVVIGALGMISFPHGWHVYCGSALGPGGLSRATRHIRVANGRGGKPHWHIDYLLTDPHFHLTAVLCATTPLPLECMVARGLCASGTPVSGFGCSDCHCLSHLFFFREHPCLEVKRVMKESNLAVWSIHNTQTI